MVYNNSSNPIMAYIKWNYSNVMVHLIYWPSERLGHGPFDAYVVGGWLLFICNWWGASLADAGNGIMGIITCFLLSGSTNILPNWPTYSRNSMTSWKTKKCWEFWELSTSKQKSGMYYVHFFPVVHSMRYENLEFCLNASISRWRSW